MRHLPLLLVLAVGSAAGAVSCTSMAAEPATVYYIVEENGGVTLSNMRRDPMPANAVIVGTGRPAGQAAGRQRAEHRPASDRSDVPVLEICTEDGRTTDCDHR